MGSHRGLCFRLRERRGGGGYGRLPLARTKAKQWIMLSKINGSIPIR